MPSRRSWRHTLRTPYTRKFSSHTRPMCSRNCASRRTRAGNRPRSAFRALPSWYIDGAIGSSPQIGSTPYSSRCASMNDVMAWVGGRAPSRCPAGDCCAITERRGEIRRRLAQDLVRPAKLAVLPLQRLEPLTLGARQPRANPLVALRASYPLTLRLGRTADLRRHRDDGRPLRFVLTLVVQDQPHCPFPKLRAVSV